MFYAGLDKIVIYSACLRDISKKRVFLEKNSFLVWNGNKMLISRRLSINTGINKRKERGSIRSKREAAAVNLIYMSTHNNLVDC